MQILAFQASEIDFVNELNQAQQPPHVTIEGIKNRFGAISEKVAVLIEIIQRHTDKINQKERERITENAMYIQKKCAKLIVELKKEAFDQSGCKVDPEQKASDQSGCSDLVSNLSNTLNLINRIQDILRSGIQGKPETRLSLCVKADMIESQFGFATIIVNRFENF